MAEQVILVFRHAEKPEPDGAPGGVDENGAPDAESLTPTGWQRAGAWAELFAPSGGRAPFLPLPTSLFASRPSDRHDHQAPEGSKSRRPLETVTPLSRKVGLPVDLRFSKGDEAAVAAAAEAAGGVAVVCWQHESIAAVAAAIAPGLPGVPAGWPGNRFNVVYRFDRARKEAPWTFSQAVPVMLAGDSGAAIQ